MLNQLDFLSMGFADGGEAVDMIALNFSETFHTVSHNTFIAKLRKYGLDEATLK